jgi:hypothetical protein
MSRAFSLCAAAAFVAWAHAAQAREQFPGVIAAELNAPQAPPCSVCHLGGKTSGATVFTPFAWTMRAHGLSSSISSVQSAIEGVKADNVDSDGDGVPDWQEIVAGTDPNAPGTAKDIQDPQLGCRVGGASSGRAGAWAASAILLVSLIRRRRIKRRACDGSRARALLELFARQRRQSPRREQRR